MIIPTLFSFVLQVTLQLCLNLTNSIIREGTRRTFR